MKNTKLFLRNLHEITFYIFYFCSVLFFVNLIYLNNSYLNEILNYPLFIVFAIMMQSEFLMKNTEIEKNILNKLAILNVFVIVLLLIIDITY
jgi:hypothetical protein